MVAKDTAICEVFFKNMFAQRTQASAMYKNTAKTNVSAQQKRRKPSPKQVRNHKICSPGLPTRHMEKNTRLSKNQLFSPTHTHLRTVQAFAPLSPGKIVPSSCLCLPDDHALSTFSAGGFYVLILLPLSYLSCIPPFVRILHTSIAHVH